ncbi:PaaI family thioesterase [Haladaptatus sp. ZSTT2]|uniref:PaaI family thioesterase n=1 Tax=Haladaptatus sp. ZSTT2 TaxID=3120515 RepID=UPI00300F2CF4
MTAIQLAVQDSWPELTCYGCGPANHHGFQLKSYEDGEALVATVHPDTQYNAGFAQVLYGGYIASVIDCHAMWTAMTAAYRAEGRPLGSQPRIVCVTGRLDVSYLRPTPIGPIHLRGWVEGDVGPKMRVRVELGPEGEVTATGSVLAVQYDLSRDPLARPAHP